MKSIPILAAICLLAISAHAQERTAGGALDVQMTWTALKGIADAAKHQAEVATIAANAALDKTKKIEACGLKGMFYTPEKAGADGEGCAAIGGNNRWTPSNINPHLWAKGGYIYTSHFAQRGIPACPTGAGLGIRCATKGSTCYERYEVTYNCGGSQGGNPCDKDQYRMWVCD